MFLSIDRITGLLSYEDYSRLAFMSFVSASHAGCNYLLGFIVNESVDFHDNPSRHMGGGYDRSDTLDY